MNTPRLTVIALAVLCSLSVAGSASAKTITTDTTDGLNINNVYTSDDDRAVAKESSMWQTAYNSIGAVRTVQGDGLYINSDASALTKPYLVTGLSVRTGSAQRDTAAASTMNFKSESFTVHVIGTGKDKGFNSNTETDATTAGIFISGRLGKTSSRILTPATCILTFRPAAVMSMEFMSVITQRPRTITARRL